VHDAGQHRQHEPTLVRDHVPVAYDEELAGRIRGLVAGEPRQLASWVERGAAYARSLPAKGAKK